MSTIKLRLREDSFAFINGARIVPESAATKEGFVVPAVHAAEVIDAIRRAYDRAPFRSYHELKALEQAYASERLDGWHHGVLWISGTPSPLLAMQLRVGCGLSCLKPVDEDMVELCWCLLCEQSLPRDQFKVIELNRHGLYGRCRQCEGLAA